jgi:hypothetical protein
MRKIENNTSENIGKLGLNQGQGDETPIDGDEKDDPNIYIEE